MPIKLRNRTLGNSQIVVGALLALFGVLVLGRLVVNKEPIRPNASQQVGAPAPVEATVVEVGTSFWAGVGYLLVGAGALGWGIATHCQCADES